MPLRCITLLTIVAFATSSIFGCASSGQDEGLDTPRPRDMTRSATTSLYDRIGGEPAIQTVIDNLIDVAMKDPKVNFTREKTEHKWEATPENVKKLKRRLVQFLGSATGGPQKYEGDDMITAHKGMKITEAEWTAFAADLKSVLDRLRVKEREQDELLEIVGTLKDSIVGK